MRRWQQIALGGALVLVLFVSVTYWFRTKAENSQLAPAPVSSASAGLSMPSGARVEKDGRAAPAAEPETAAEQSGQLVATATELAPGVGARSRGTWETARYQQALGSTREEPSSPGPSAEASVPDASTPDTPAADASAPEAVASAAAPTKARTPEATPVAKSATVEGSFRNGVSSFYRLVSLTCLVDGNVAFRRTGKGIQGRLFEQRVSPGPHTTSVVAEYLGNGGSVFSYTRGYRFKVQGSRRFVVNSDQPTRLVVTMSEQGGPTTAFEDRLRMNISAH